jgi:hypothetical protein
MYSRGRCQWLIPVILATQEAEIQITVQSHPGIILRENLPQKYPTQKRAVEWLKV